MNESMSATQEVAVHKTQTQMEEFMAPTILSRNNSLTIENPKCHDYSKQITFVYICSLCSSILFHILDVGTDLYLAYQYYKFQQTSYCMLTLAFFIIPAFINTLISVRMYADEKDNISSKKWVLRSLLLSIMFAPVVRYLKTLSYAIKLKRNKEESTEKYEKYYKPLLKEDSNLALLRVIECFLEAAPQQVLQIAILLRMEDKTNNSLLKTYQYITIATSLSSIAWSFAIYNRSIRFAREDKRKMNWTGSIAQFTWLLCITTARILSISEVASVFPKNTFLACVGHWFIMTMWLAVLERTWFCYSPLSDPTCKIKRTMEVFFCAVLGLVYIFTFLPFNDGPTRYKYIFYYFVCFIENITAVFLWVTNNYSRFAYCSWFLPLAILTVTLFFIGIASMIVYYTYFHPEIGLKNKPTRNDNDTVKRNSSQFSKKEEEKVDKDIINESFGSE